MVTRFDNNLSGHLHHRHHIYKGAHVWLPSNVNMEGSKLNSSLTLVYGMCWRAKALTFNMWPCKRWANWRNVIQPCGRWGATWEPRATTFKMNIQNRLKKYNIYMFMAITMWPMRCQVKSMGINIKLASSSHPANPTWEDKRVKI